MKKLLSVLILASSLFASNAMVDGMKAWNAVEAGEKQYSRVDAGFFLGYVFGVKNTLNNIIFCIPKEVPSKQILNIVADYVKNNPDQWSKSYTSLVITPLKEVYPCPKK